MVIFMLCRNIWNGDTFSGAFTPVTHRALADLDDILAAGI